MTDAASPMPDSLMHIRAASSAALLEQLRLVQRDFQRASSIPTLAKHHPVLVSAIGLAGGLVMGRAWACAGRPSPPPAPAPVQAAAAPGVTSGLMGMLAGPVVKAALRMIMD